MMRILHFSDIHINDTYDQDKVLNHFIEDIQKHEKYDLVVCSGDIASKGNFSKDNIIKFFAAIKNAIGQDTPIITCPGNHDINLKKRKNRYTVNYESVKSHEEANKFFDDLHEDPDSNLTAHFEEYNEIASIICEKSIAGKIFFTKKIELNGELIGIASLNSAWFTRGGGNDDYGKLFLSQHQVEKAADEIADCKLKIAIFHHPVEWLAHSEGPYVRSALNNNFDILLCGHTHHNNASSLSTNLGNVFMSNTGCLYQTRNFFNGYSIIEIKEDSINITAREYYSDRNTFGKSIRFSEDSTINWSLKKKEIAIIDGEIISHISKITSKKLLSVNSGIAPKDLSNIFVEPPLSYVNEKEYYASERDVGKNSGQLTSLDKLFRKKSNVFFLGKRESGKSTLINYLAANKFQHLHNQAQLGLVIDLERARTPDKNITKATLITNALNFIDSNLSKKELISMLEKGSLVIAFDNFNIHSKNDRKEIFDFMEQYSLCRYVACSTEPDIIIRDKKVHEELFQEQVYLHSFKKVHTEKLVKNWFSNDIESRNNSLKFIKKLIDQLNVPSTPFLISMLLWVVEKNKNSSHIFNEASVVQVIIEGLLNKFGEEKKREDFDFTNLSHFLKEFSYYLDCQNTTVVNISDFDCFKIKYFSDRGLTSKEDLRTELIEKGILYGDATTIGFKFDCFRAFFLAEKFNTDNDIWLKIIEEERTHNYSIEFEYYSGIHRDTENLLQQFHNLIKESFKKVSFNVDQLSLENDNSILLSQTLFGSITEKIQDNKFEEEIIDNHQDLDLPNVASINPSISREKTKKSDDSHYNTFVTLKTFAAILRNSELVANLELKKSSLDDLFTYWNQVFLFLISLTKNDAYQLLGEEVSVEKKEELVQLFTVVITFVYSYLIVEKSSSAKMKPLFENYFDSDNIGNRTLAILCYADIDLDKAIKVTKQSLVLLRNKPFYLQAIYFFYLHKFVENGEFTRSREKSIALKSIIGEIAFTLSGKSSNQKTHIISNTIARLESTKNQAIQDKVT